ncbi:hypothetical protein [Aquihabitans sp. McL0605]|uniref:hypothetical protein n=1 Tax=Aquihabitans sp. McL0605 TaxID=3415671 RepID=UPI003CE8623D
MNDDDDIAAWFSAATRDIQPPDRLAEITHEPAPVPVAPASRPRRAGWLPIAAVLILVAVMAATAITLHDRSSTVTTGPATQTTDPVAVHVDLAAQRRILLLPGETVTLVLAVTPAATKVTAATGDIGGSDPSVPAGFSPGSATVVGGDFYLLGEQCPTGESCRTVLLRSAESPIDWKPVPLDIPAGSEPSLLDAGTFRGSYSYAPGSIGGPALRILDRDGTWSDVEWPKGISGPMMSCSTRGHDYLFGRAQDPTSGASSSGSTGGTGTTAPAGASSWAVYALQDDLTWTKVVEQPTLSSPDSAAIAAPVLCSSGSIAVPTQGGGTVTVQPDGDSYRATASTFPGFSAPTSDGPFPRAGITFDTSHIVTATGDTDLTVRTGTDALTTAESDDLLALLGTSTDGTTYLYRWDQH